MINIQPVLIGRMLRLRPMKEQDFQGLYKVASDKLIWQLHPDPRRSEREYFRNGFFKNGLQCGGCLVMENTKGQIIGSSRYYHYRPQYRDIAIGYTFLRRDYWGETANRCVKHLMMSHAYQWTDNIFFSVGINNLRSRRAMEKLGGKLLTPEMEKARNYTVPGSVIYEIWRKDFKGFI